jgi:hypothetical protein
VVGRYLQRPSFVRPIHVGEAMAIIKANTGVITQINFFTVP